MTIKERNHKELAIIASVLKDRIIEIGKVPVITSFQFMAGKTFDYNEKVANICNDTPEIVKSYLTSNVPSFFEAPIDFLLGIQGGSILHTCELVLSEDIKYKIYRKYRPLDQLDPGESWYNFKKYLKVFVNIW